MLWGHDYGTLCSLVTFRYCTRAYYRSHGVNERIGAFDIMPRASKQVLCTVCIWQWFTSGHGVKLPIWKGYHIFLNLYWPNRYICTIEGLPPWVVPIFCLAHGLLVILHVFILKNILESICFFQYPSNFDLIPLNVITLNFTKLISHMKWLLIFRCPASDI